MITNAVNNAKRYDWQTWLVGILRSFVGGGAGAVASGFGTIAVHPEDLHGGVLKIFASMGISFLFVGVVHMAIFLSTHASPDLVGGSISEAAGSQ